MRKDTIIDAELQSVPVTVTQEKEKPWWETIPAEFKDRKPTILFYSTGPTQGSLISHASIADFYTCAFTCLRRAFGMTQEAEQGMNNSPSKTPVI